MFAELTLELLVELLEVSERTLGVSVGLGSILEEMVAIILSVSIMVFFPTRKNLFPRAVDCYIKNPWRCPPLNAVRFIPPPPPFSLRRQQLYLLLDISQQLVWIKHVPDICKSLVARDRGARNYGFEHHLVVRVW